MDTDESTDEIPKTLKISKLGGQLILNQINEKIDLCLTNLCVRFFVALNAECTIICFVAGYERTNLASFVIRKTAFIITLSMLASIYVCHMNSFVCIEKFFVCARPCFCVTYMQISLRSSNLSLLASNSIKKKCLVCVHAVRSF